MHRFGSALAILYIERGVANPPLWQRLSYIERGISQSTALAVPQLQGYT